MKISLPVTLLLCAASASADQFHLVSGVDCDTAHSRLSVWFRGGWNKRGEELLRERGPAGVNPSDLVEISGGQDGKYRITKKSVRRTCRIGRTEYVVVFSPSLGPGFHPEGNCATRRGVAVEIQSGKRLLAHGDVDACTEQGEVLTQIVLAPRQRPVYTFVPAEEFYR